MKALWAMLIFLYAISTYAVTNPFHCAKYMPAGLQQEKLKNCNDKVTWGYELSKIEDTDPKLFDEMVKKKVLSDNNTSAASFQFSSENKKVVYRSSFLSGVPACLDELVKERGVQTIVNLYSGTLNSHNELAQQERLAFQSFGGHVYTNVLNYEDNFKKLSKQEIFKKLKEIINLIETSPGNVLIHCYGGMHRTGLVFGVMQKCLHKLPIERVLDEYKCHAAWESKEREGGYKKENETVLREFPCASLK